jgi:ABC-type nitrate/sulfonate/bicarbonate transport system permease component
MDRETAFLCLLVVLFPWDLAYLLGLRNPDRVPHPFVFFSRLGDIEFLRDFARVMLRQTIFISVTGGALGFGIGLLLLKSTGLTQKVLSFLRQGLWLPFVFLFAAPDPFALGIAAVALCTCYHYLVAVSVLGLHGRESKAYVAREAILQAFFFSLLSQMWWKGWTWFDFVPTYRPAEGVGVLITLLVSLVFINWIFHFDFDLAAERCRTIHERNRGNPTWNSFCALLLFAVLVFLLLWEVIGAPGSLFPSPLNVLTAGFAYSDMHRNIRISLLEIFGGIILGAVIATLLVALLSVTRGILRNALSTIFPLLYISPIVLWLLWWATNSWKPPLFMEYSHKLIAVAFLSSFTLAQSLWALRSCPLIFRLLLAVHDALPFAFVAMLFSERWAATGGLGFAMIMAHATHQTARGLAVFVITVAMFAIMLGTLKWGAKHVTKEKACFP